MIDVLQRIEELRIERNWSKYELSKRAGIQENTISSWYQDNRLPSLRSLEKVCNAFGITLSMLVAESDDLVELSPEDWETLNRFQCLSNKQRESFLELLDAYPKDQKS